LLRWLVTSTSFVGGHGRGRDVHARRPPGLATGPEIDRAVVDEDPAIAHQAIDPLRGIPHGNNSLSLDAEQPAIGLHDQTVCRTRTDREDVARRDRELLGLATCTAIEREQLPPDRCDRARTGAHHRALFLMQPDR
jgi:hypothetical protein